MLMSLASSIREAFFLFIIYLSIPYNQEAKSLHPVGMNSVKPLIHAVFNSLESFIHKCCNVAESL